MTTPTPRWTAEVQDLVRDALVADRFERWGYSETLAPQEASEWRRAEATQFNTLSDVLAVLTALADAGHLIPVGGETPVHDEDLVSLPSLGRVVGRYHMTREVTDGGE